MHIIEHQVDEIAKLRQLARKEKSAVPRDRYRVAALALEGRATGDIQERLQRSRGFVQRWAYAYREGGVEALRAKPHPGRKPKLSGEMQEAFKARLDAGPTHEDSVCTLRGKDAQRILKDEFGVLLSLNGAYRTLHRLGYSCLKPRPRHEKQDPRAQREFRTHAPLLFAP